MDMSSGGGDETGMLRGRNSPWKQQQQQQAVQSVATSSGSQRTPETQEGELIRIIRDIEMSGMGLVGEERKVS